jgi:transketolase
MDSEKIAFLKEKAKSIRVSIIEMLIEAGSGHTAGPLGMADIFTALYFEILKHNPKNPSWKDRDILVLSNGHICPVLYATMAEAGYFPKEELRTLRRFGSRLQGHPHREALPGLETSSGPLGSGLSQAVGMALADRIDHKKDRKIYCLMSDGEQDCGNVWEAAMLAGKEKLDNLIALIDRNKIQIDGFTEDVMPLEPLNSKWQSFNWRVLEINGNDFSDILKGFKEAAESINQPTIIIAHNTPGKGVPDWENKYEWHGKPPTKEEGRVAIEIIKSSV